MKCNFFSILSIKLIEKVWHGNYGRKFVKNNHIICRFYPTCSNYAILAIRKHGFIKGWVLVYRRLMRCNPYNTDSAVDFP
ncbi:membrane protein insertion efficiency factor YidD [Methanospirillum lacunae]|uniref:Membrane protein insertion efficiency factor YidD n=1 Tax=Methanospirillum lacunae TaxID=668570 RepID=A0A2V2NF39_9EURY|nr:hypothetical protein DK846_01850 [Methanospirillum lacunae]